LNVNKKLKYNKKAEEIILLLFFLYVFTMYEKYDTILKIVFSM
jgi:hypothetical protein